VVAHLSLDRDDMEAAARHAREALTLSQKFGSKFLEAQSLASLAAVAHQSGDADQALRLAREAQALIQTTPMTFIGPRIFSVLAACTSDPEERATALAKAEEILAAGSVSHNHFWFRRAAMEQGLECGAWDEVDRQADALADYTRPEPVPWSDFYCLRGRTLAAIGRGNGGTEPAATLRRLKDEAVKADLLSALPKIEAAMRSLKAA
jgi:hypothetical protein